MPKRDEFIDVWYIFNESISDEALLREYRTLLNPEEIIQLERMRFPNRQQQFLVTRVAIRCILSFYFSSVSPSSWTFTRNQYGKPKIDCKEIPDNFSFNISHTDKLVSIAVSFADVLGIDIEYVNRRTDVLGIANSFFSTSEAASLRQLDPTLQRDRFFDLWTLKEALIKAIGHGLSIPLNQFNYSFSNSGKINLDFDDQWVYPRADWHFWQILPSKSHKTAIAVNSEAPDTYKLSMREYVPLVSFEPVTYPIGTGHVATLAT